MAPVGQLQPGATRYGHGLGERQRVATAHHGSVLETALHSSPTPPDPGGDPPPSIGRFRTADQAGQEVCFSHVTRCRPVTNRKNPTIVAPVKTQTVYGKLRIGVLRLAFRRA